MQLARAARESSRQGDECPKRAVPACAVDRAGAACSQLRMRTFWKITEFHKCEEQVKTLFKHAFTKYFFLEEFLLLGIGSRDSDRLNCLLGPQFSGRMKMQSFDLKQKSHFLVGFSI